MEMNLAEVQVTEQKYAYLMEVVKSVNGRIEDDITHEVGLNAIVEGRTLLDKWISIFEPIRVTQRAALEATYAQINKIKVPVETLIKEIGAKCGDYELRRREAARIEEMKRQAEANKQAENDVLEVAEEFEKNGMAKEAEAVISQSIPAAPAFATSIAPVQVKGIRSRVKWKAKLVNLDAFRKAYKEGKLPLNVMAPDLAVLNDLAGALQAEFQIPGFEAYEDISYGKSGGKRKE